MSKRIDIEQQLRDAISQSGRSLNQLGQAAGVDSGRLSRFMRGERGLTSQAVTQLCQALGLKLCPDEAAPQAEPLEPPPKAKASTPPQPPPAKGKATGQSAPARSKGKPGKGRGKKGKES